MTCNFMHYKYRYALFSFFANARNVLAFRSLLLYFLSFFLCIFCSSQSFAGGMPVGAGIPTSIPTFGSGGKQCSDLIKQTKHPGDFECGLDHAKTGDIVALNLVSILYLVSQGGGGQKQYPLQMICRVEDMSTQPFFIDVYCPGLSKHPDASGLSHNAEGCGITRRFYKNCGDIPAKEVNACGGPAGTNMGGATSTNTSTSASGSNACSCSDPRQEACSFSCGTGAAQVWDQFVVFHAPSSNRQATGNCKTDKNILLYQTSAKCKDQGGGNGQQAQPGTCLQDVLNSCPPPANLVSDGGFRDNTYGPGGSCIEFGGRAIDYFTCASQSGGGTGQWKWCYQLYGGSDMGDTGAR